jgi:hypothetical protein
LATPAPHARGNLDAEEFTLDVSSSPTLLYLYCVLDAGTDAERLLASGAVAGIDKEHPLFPVATGGLVGAVSRVPRASFNEAALNELVADLSRLAPLVMRHEEVVRALFSATSALVPMAFGAVYRAEAGVLGFLEDQADRLSSVLDSVRGKQEWGVKVFADAAVARSAAEQSSPALRAMDEEAQAVGPGRAYLLQRKREELLAGEVRSFVGQALEEIAEALIAESVDGRLDEISANQQGPTELVLKAAFLVDDRRGDAFQASAARLIDSYEPKGFAIELNGPWAPYSFTGETA